MGWPCGAGSLISLSFQREEHVLASLLAQGERKTWGTDADLTHLADPTQDQQSPVYPQT